jgi:serine/threonine protein kinase
LPEVNPADLAFADIAIREGMIATPELNQVILDFGNGLVLRREDEGLGPYLVRTGHLTIQQLYDLALRVDMTSVNDESRAEAKSPKQDNPFGIVLTGLNTEEIKTKAVAIVAELRGIKEEQAAAICSFPVVPAMTRLTKEEADEAKTRFQGIGVECRIIKWKRQGKGAKDGPLSKSGSQRLRPVSGRQKTAIGVEHSEGSTDTGATKETAGSARLKPVFSTPGVPNNPFAGPVETFEKTNLENTNSIGGDSVDFLVVGSNESDVIFLEAPADDNTATAVTVFSESALDPGNDSLLGRDKGAKDKPETNKGKAQRLGIGSVVAAFRLTKLLGKGGFANVYLGEHIVLGHKAAVKVYKTRDSKLLRRITRREATLIARLRHPRLISILNIGQEAGSFFIIMDYVPGTALGQYVKDHGPLSPQRAAMAIRDIAEALDFIHRNNLVHRDVKPSNFLLEDNGRARLLDFELIKSYSEQLTEILPEDMITQSGQLIGTPRFMSPEQIDDVQKILPTSDIYSLGASLYYMITGQYPFTGKSLIQIIKEVLIKEPIPPRKLCEDLPAELDHLILQMLAKDPAVRPQSMSEVIEALEKLDLAVHAKPVRRLAPVTTRVRKRSPSNRVTGVYRLPTDTVFVDEGSHISKPMFLYDETEAENHGHVKNCQDDLGSTIVSVDLNVGKIDNHTVIATPAMTEADLDSVRVAKKWEELQSHEVKEKEILVTEITEHIRNSVSLSPARQWQTHREAEAMLEEAISLHRKREDIQAREKTKRVLELMPENSQAHDLYQELSERLPPNLSVLLELSKNQKKQLYEALSEFIDEHVNANEVAEYLLERGPDGERGLKVFLERNNAAIWQHDILDRLFERNQLRQIVKNMGLQISRRTAKRRIIASLLQTMGFCADKIWQ